MTKDTDNIEIAAPLDLTVGCLHPRIQSDEITTSATFQTSQTPHSHISEIETNVHQFYINFGSIWGKIDA